MFQYEAKVIRWVDGDTAWLDLDLGFRVHIEAEIRLAHVNTPEVVGSTVSGPDDRALAFVSSKVPVQSICVAEISRSEKWGRWLAVLRYRAGSTDRDEILRSGTNLNDELVQAGLAVPYEGGRK